MPHPTPSMPTQKKATVIDLNVITDEAGQVDEESIEILNLFITLSLKHIDDIIAAQKDNDHAALENLAHGLKGAARSAGLPALGDASNCLEKSAHKAEPTADLVKQLIDEFERVKIEIAKLTQL